MPVAPTRPGVPGFHGWDLKPVPLAALPLLCGRGAGTPLRRALRVGTLVAYPMEGTHEMARTTKLADLEGENALVIVGTIAPLLRQLAREVESLKGLDDRYRTEALSGDYAHLCATSERYAVQYLQTTLNAHEGDLG
jgi:hypothetical protein